MAKKYKHSMKELQELQRMPLEFKVEITKSRIQEFYEAVGGKCFVSFSGGKDSTVLLDLARSLYPDMKAVFANTGVDYPSVTRFVKSFGNVDIVYPKKHFPQIIQEDGLVFPSKDVSMMIKDARKGVKYALQALKGEKINGGADPKRQRYKKWAYIVDLDVKISDVCCDYLKEKPMNDYQKKTGMKPMVAIMAVESFRRTLSWLSSGCNILDKGKERSKPMSFWTEQDVLYYIVQNKLPIAEAYGNIVSDLYGRLLTTGMNRTGCMFCPVPLAHGANLQEAKKAAPKLYDTLINKFGYGDTLKKLGVDYEQDDGAYRMQF